MRNICDRFYRHRLSFRMIDTKRFMKAEFTDSEFFVKLCHLPLEVYCVRRICKSFCQITDTIPNTPVKNLPRIARIFIFKKNLHTFCRKFTLHLLKIIIKQFFKYLKVMKGNPVNASVNLSYNLT